MVPTCRNRLATSMIDHRSNQALPNHLEAAFVTRELQQALRQTIFSSGMQVSPRQANQIGEQFGSAFFSFWSNRTREDASEFGRKLAMAGLGPRSVLSMTEKLRVISWKGSSPDDDLLSIASDFCNSLLEGYMTGREERLLEIQERTHRAYITALEQKHDGDG